MQGLHLDTLGFTWFQLCHGSHCRITAHLQQHILPSNADSTAYEMYLMDPPTQDRQIVQRAGWAHWLTLTKIRCLEFSPQICHQSFSEVPGHHSHTYSFTTSLTTLYAEGGTSTTVESYSHSRSLPNPKQETPASFCHRENLLTGLLPFNLICQSYFYFLELSKI